MTPKIGNILKPRKGGSLHPKQELTKKVQLQTLEVLTNMFLSKLNLLKFIFAPQGVLFRGHRNLRQHFELLLLYLYVYFSVTAKVDKLLMLHVVNQPSNVRNGNDRHHYGILLPEHLSVKMLLRSRA